MQTLFNEESHRKTDIRPKTLTRYPSTVHIKQHRLQSARCCYRVLLSHLFFHPVLEHFIHVHSDLLQLLIPDVDVDVGGGLVVGVTDDFHGDQKVNTAFVEQGDVVVPKNSAGSGGFNGFLHLTTTQPNQVYRPFCDRNWECYPV